MSCWLVAIVTPVVIIFMTVKLVRPFFARASAMDRSRANVSNGTHGFPFTARDGLEIPGYLTLPKDRKLDEAVPLIVNPHGGPFGVRDFWGYNAEHQFFC